jgi:hypothetical protein
VTSAASVTGAYKVRATLSTDIDVNNTLANAWELSSDPARRLVASKLESTSDEDWYKFTTGEGYWINLETFGLNGVDTVIEVYAPTTTMWKTPWMTDTSGGRGLGHWMLTDDDGALPSLASRLSFFAPVAGTYYVRVKPYNAGSSGAYSIVFEDRGYRSFWAEWAAYP